jgi:DHA1 family tetracycline resistance protein-like MFS transporter
MSPSTEPVTGRAGDGRRAAFVFIALTVWLDSLAQSLSFPVLPRLTQHLLGGDLVAAARWVGWLEVAWAVPQFLAAPVLGALSDRFGRRPIVVASVFGVAAELVMNALAPNVGWLLAGRVLCGLTCGAQAAAMAYVADITPPEARARRFGQLNAALWAAIIVGPALGGVLATVSLRAPFWAAAAFALANGVFGCFVLPESLPRGNRTPMDWSKANPYGAVALLARRPGLAPLALAFFLTWLAFQASANMNVLYTAYRYGWSPLAFGVFATALAAANIAVLGQLSGRSVRRLGERLTLLAGLALQAFGFAAMGLSPGAASFVAANLPVALGGVAQPVLQSAMSARVAAGEQGRLQGALGALAGLSSILAPVALTQMFAWSIAGAGGPARSGLTLLLAAAFTLAALGLVWAATRRGTPPRAL